LTVALTGASDVHVTQGVIDHVHLLLLEELLLVRGGVHSDGTARARAADHHLLRGDHHCRRHHELRSTSSYHHLRGDPSGDLLLSVHSYVFCASRKCNKRYSFR
jgi:hypothetical protein